MVLWKRWAQKLHFFSLIINESISKNVGMNIKCNKASNYDKVICTTYVISMFHCQEEIKLKFQLWSFLLKIQSTKIYNRYWQVCHGPLGGDQIVAATVGTQTSRIQKVVTEDENGVPWTWPDYCSLTQML